MVEHSYSQPRDIILFQLVDHPVDKSRKQCECVTQKQTFLLLLFLMSGYFLCSISIFYINFSIIFPLSVKQEIKGPPHGGRLHGQGRLFLPLQNEKRFFAKVSFARLFKTPDGIVCRVPGVWLLPIPTYFSCSPFYLNTLICSFYSGDQLIFISRNGNSSFITI